MSNNAYDSLRNALEKMEWPALYPFKFIVPIDKMDEIMQLFNKSDTQTKVSRNGNYISVTAKLYMYDSEKVIDIYKKAEHIEGIIAL
jgi:uncharacterized protein